MVSVEVAGVAVEPAAAPGGSVVRVEVAMPAPYLLRA